MLGVERGKRQRLNRSLTYRYKYGTSLSYRDIYPSHIGRYDLNVCSSSDPGLTGYLTANCKVDSRGYFDPENSEPDSYDPVIDKRLNAVADPKYQKKRAEITETEKDRDDDGFIRLRRRLTPEEFNREIARDPGKYGLYAIKNDLYLIPRHDNVDAKGFIELTLKPGASLNPKDRGDRDEDGFIVLQYAKDLKF